MTTAAPSTRTDWKALGRAARARYDDRQATSPGDRATLRRCALPSEIVLEGSFWRLAEDVPFPLRSRLAPVVLLYPCCDAKVDAQFRFGRYLHVALVREGERADDKRSLRFRQLIAARDEGELAARLRRLLTFTKAPVDWGVVTDDLVRWSFGGRSRDLVLRAWAQDFYSELPISRDEVVAIPTAAPSTPDASRGE